MLARLGLRGRVEEVESENLSIRKIKILASICIQEVMAIPSILKLWPSHRRRARWWRTILLDAGKRVSLAGRREMRSYHLDDIDKSISEKIRLCALVEMVKRDGEVEGRSRLEVEDVEIDGGDGVRLLIKKKGCALAYFPVLGFRVSFIRVGHVYYKILDWPSNLSEMP